MAQNGPITRNVPNVHDKCKRIIDSASYSGDDVLLGRYQNEEEEDNSLMSVRG